MLIMLAALKTIKTLKTLKTHKTHKTHKTLKTLKTFKMLKILKTQRESRERAAGGVLVLLVLIASTGLVLLLLALCRRINPWLGIIAEGILCGRLLALRSLREAAYAVRDPLLQGDVDGARRAVSMIVGRDTDPLNAEGIAKAAVGNRC